MYSYLAAHGGSPLDCIREVLDSVTVRPILKVRDTTVVVGGRFLLEKFDSFLEGIHRLL